MSRNEVTFEREVRECHLLKIIAHSILHENDGHSEHKRSNTGTTSDACLYVLLSAKRENVISHSCRIAHTYYKGHSEHQRSNTGTQDQQEISLIAEGKLRALASRGAARLEREMFFDCVCKHQTHSSKQVRDDDEVDEYASTSSNSRRMYGCLSVFFMSFISHSNTNTRYESRIA